MKRSFLAVAALTTTFAVCAMAQTNQPPSAPSPTSASAPTGATKIAVIAFQPAVAATNEGRQAIAKIQAKYEPQRDQLKTLSDQIDTLKKQLQASGSSLSQDARATQLRTIDDKEKTLQRQAQSAQSDFQQDMSEALQAIEQKFYTVLQDYAQTNGYGLVLDMSSQQTPVVWASRAADISQAVIQAYNEKSGIAAPTAPKPSSSSAPHGTTTRHHAATSH